MRLGIMRLVTPSRRGARFGLSLLALSLLGIGSIHAQQVGTNVNMVTGTQWPGGDPFLQRQNEPSMAISSRNPLHMVAGDNDYRSVDLPAVSGEVAPTGDAWLGWFTSFDGGQTWTSTLVPGYPQDTSLAGELSPIHGLGAGADPMVRAGTNGMFYYSGLAFNRQARRREQSIRGHVHGRQQSGGRQFYSVSLDHCSGHRDIEALRRQAFDCSRYSTFMVWGLRRPDPASEKYPDLPGWDRVRSVDPVHRR